LVSDLATEIDATGEGEKCSNLARENASLSQLEDRVSRLEQRVKFLEDNSEQIRRKRRVRRKAKEILKDFQVNCVQCSAHIAIVPNSMALKPHLKTTSKSNMGRKVAGINLPPIEPLIMICTIYICLQAHLLPLLAIARIFKSLPARLQA
jgi:hypothetical protein